jgi:hypothetical protein
MHGKGAHIPKCKEEEYMLDGKERGRTKRKSPTRKKER